MSTKFFQKNIILIIIKFVVRIVFEGCRKGLQSPWKMDKGKQPGE